MNEKIKCLAQLAHKHGSLKNQYEQATRAHIDQAEPLASEEFWPLVEELAQALIKAKGKVDAPNSKKVIEEFIRSRLFDSRARCSPWEMEGKRGAHAGQMLATWEKLASFTKAYSKTKNVIYKLCDKFADLDMSDDTFGDFCDSFVLAGSDMIKRIKDGDIATMSQLRKATVDHPLQRFMLRGENYMEMMLGEFLAEKLPSVVRDLFPEAPESVEECQTPGVVNTMDLQSIVDALAPVLEKTTRPFPGFVQVNLTTAEHAALTKVVQMLQLADLVNYKKAQDSFPRLLQALKLVLAIADHPDQNPTEKISLSTKTRAQLDSALKFSEK
jgi:hypothetical protein